jgi:hypothetical protein
MSIPRAVQRVHAHRLLLVELDIDAFEIDGRALLLYDSFPFRRVGLGFCAVSVSQCSAFAMDRIKSIDGRWV